MVLVADEENGEAGLTVTLGDELNKFWKKNEQKETAVRLE